MSDIKAEPKADATPTAEVVLELRHVTFSGRSTDSLRLMDADLSVHAGELVMLQIDRSDKARDTVSMLQGLQPINHGEVIFKNQDWLGEDYSRHFQMRSQIGRVFEEHGWIQNMTVYENVIMASLHHGQTQSTIEQRLKHWAKHFELPLISRERPAFVESSVLQLHQWIRALIHHPSLILLEHPMQSVAAHMRSKLIGAINQLRDAGAAVIWFTSNPNDLSTAITGPVFRMTISGGQFEMCGGDISE
ncbi:Trehalose import ATP-binding protein SugC [Rubripirellula amarantea]|uniref:Trehalose import ATP-binding protein SugC n=1 Tax=Rubripirellula amarantea TaxID=2527999 RepID=A0A5C5WI05_9BACT|nr:hypothetical protein [Rubripirellula amarantea]TWT50418.1 Trehalose import ATP-binding protein SugC [Rubripirellula amarantea]